MDVAKDNGVVTITLEDDFTNALLNDFRELVQFEKDAGNSSFQIDFTGTKVIDSMAIGCLVATYNSLRHKDGTLQLINVPETIRGILKVMHLDRIMTVNPET